MKDDLREIPVEDLTDEQAAELRAAAERLVLAVGYRDGCVLFIRMDDESILQARPAGDGGAISALAWNGDGSMLAFGTEGGAAGVLTLPRV